MDDNSGDHDDPMGKRKQHNDVLLFYVPMLLRGDGAVRLRVHGYDVLLALRGVLLALHACALR